MTANTSVWSKEKVWEWYNSRPWIRGCNFMSSDCCNRVDQWQEYGFNERIKTADRELALAASIGYNSIRLILQFEVWKEQHDGFMDRLETYLQTASKHGISAMICFGNDCSVPKELYKEPVMGRQSVDVGYHGGVKISPHSGYRDAVGYTILDDPVKSEQFFEMIREIISKYRNDPRVIIWDLFNEAGNGNRGEVSVPHIQKMFDIARKLNPVQPLTSGIWSNYFNGGCHAEKVAVANSDIITFHCYCDYCTMIKVIAELKKHGRPMLNTEWLHRIQHSSVQEMFPLFFLEKIGCYNWGFVAGAYQTYEPWEGIWKQEAIGEGEGYDFTKWQHDLFRPNLRPYDPKEIRVIKEFCCMADSKRNPLSQN